jgi:hypothetical protein
MYHYAAHAMFRANNLLLAVQLLSEFHKVTQAICLIFQDSLRSLLLFQEYYANILKKSILVFQAMMDIDSALIDIPAFRFASMESIALT